MRNETTFQFSKCNERTYADKCAILHINAIRTSVDILRNDVIKYDIIFTAKNGNIHGQHVCVSQLWNTVDKNLLRISV